MLPEILTCVKCHIIPKDVYIMLLNACIMSIMLLECSHLYIVIINATLQIINVSNNVELHFPNINVDRIQQKFHIRSH